VQLPRLTGLGPETQCKLSKLGITHVQALLWHLPLRYENRAKLTPIAELTDGQTALIQGCITRIIRGKKIITLILEDATGSLSIRLFQQRTWQAPHLLENNWLRCYGMVQTTLQPTAIQPSHIHKPNQINKHMLQPDWQRCEANQVVISSDRYTPIYPTTAGLSQNKLRALIQQMLEHAHTQSLLQPLRSISASCWPKQLPSLLDALHLLHAPPLSLNLEKAFDLEKIALDKEQEKQPLEQARASLAFLELTHHFAELARLQHLPQQALIAPVLTIDTNTEQQFLQQLPFQLTDGQQQAWLAIADDLKQNQPMRRLLQGDVGCGKTIITALAALAAIHNGYQVALMVPTEILAQQHYLSFKTWFADANIALLTGSISAKPKRELKAALQRGDIQIIIGTQALFQSSVHFHRLGLVMIDEQHRFGVAQRLALVRRSTHLIPHQLTLTATPIPRTLAMTLSGQRQVSVITQMPHGRKPIITAVMSEQKRPELLQRIEFCIAQGEQVFWVCPLIEQSEVLTCAAAERTHQQLCEQLSASTATNPIRIGLLHGRMSDADKLTVLQAFREQQLQLLVATSVIEVGVDIPNANLLIIENAERQGLAQLHQLRGRVGRGQQQGYCILLYKPPLGAISRQRLDILRQHTDGFLVSQHDLEIRGPGQWLGKQQSGYRPFRFADMPKDSELAEQASALVCTLQQDNPRLLPSLMNIWQPYEAITDGMSLADG
jgi:ATP-dependent DNA helicase RecG